MVRQLARARIELRIAQSLLAEHDRHRTGRARDLGGEQLRQRCGRDRRRRAVPRLQDRVAFIGGENVEAADSPIRTRNRRVEQSQEPTLQIGKLTRGVERGVGVEIDPERSAIRAVVNRDRQILDRPVRQIVRGAAVARKAQIVIEPHEVDRGAPQRAIIDQPTEISPQIRELAVLVIQQLADLPRRLADDLRNGHA